MTRSIIVQAAAAAVATVFVSSTVLAESPSIENPPFVGSKTRAEVQAEFKTSYPGGNPWSSQYNMNAPRSTLTSEQARSAYKMSRDEVNALNAEDSGSAYFSSMPLILKGSATMGAPALDSSNAERDL